MSEEKQSDAVDKELECPFCNDRVSAAEVRPHLGSVHGITKNLESHVLGFVRQSCVPKDQVGGDEEEVKPPWISDPRTIETESLEHFELTCEDLQFSLALDKFLKGRCVFQCALCQRQYQNSFDFWTHVNGEHELTAKEYVDKHGKSCVSKVQLRCKICAREVLHDEAEIWKHLCVKHESLSIKNYFRDYEFRANVCEISSSSLLKESQLKSGKNLISDPTDLENSVQEKLLEHPNITKYNGCVYECKVCQKMFTSQLVVLQHLCTIHNLNSTKYTEQYGPLRILENYWTCELCEIEFLQDSLVINRHLENGHGCNLLHYDLLLYPGSEMVNMALYKCPECPDHIGVSRKTFLDHITEKHDLTERDYLAKHLSLPYASFSMNCVLCKEELETGPKLIKHIQEHSMSLKNYRFLRWMTMKFPKLNILAIVLEPEPSVCHEIPAFYNGCTFRCKLCLDLFKSSLVLKSHVFQKHGQLFEDYTKEHGESRVVDKRYECLVCKAAIVHDLPDIKAHFEEQHATKVEEYYHKNAEQICKIMKDNKKKKVRRGTLKEATDSGRLETNQTTKQETLKRSPLKVKFDSNHESTETATSGSSGNDSSNSPDPKRRKTETTAATEMIPTLPLLPPLRLILKTAKTEERNRIRGNLEAAVGANTRIYSPLPSSENKSLVAGAAQQNSDDNQSLESVQGEWNIDQNSNNDFLIFKLEHDYVKTAPIKK